MCNEDADNNLIEGQVSELFDRQYIEIQGIGFLRGRSIKDNLFIIDEAQNIRPEILLDIVSCLKAETFKAVFNKSYVIFFLRNCFFPSLSIIAHII